MKTRQAKRDAARPKDGGESSSEELLETPELATGVGLGRLKSAVGAYQTLNELSRDEMRRAREIRHE